MFWCVVQFQVENLHYLISNFRSHILSVDVVLRSLYKFEACVGV
jgi:hypothetical protein